MKSTMNKKLATYCRKTAQKTADTACTFWFHQPAVPEKVKALKK